MRLSHNEFVERAKQSSPYIIPLDIYKGVTTPIKVKCELCDNEWVIKNPLRLVNYNCVCPNCKCMKIGHNDTRYLANSHPDIAINLFDKNDGYRCMTQSAKKVDWICPNCGEVVSDIPVNKVVNRKHIPCKKCSDGISYPNKFMYNVLKQLGEEFITEYSPSWIKPKRYDFYLPNKNIIIEMDGAIGHGGKTIDGTDSIMSKSVDDYKDLEASRRDICVIRIDCKISDKDYICNNITTSKLCNYLNFDNIDWELCEKESLSSLLTKTCNLWNQTNDIVDVINRSKLSRSTVIRYLKTGNKYGFCKYDARQQMKTCGYKNIINAYTANRKAVMCIETKEVFESCREAYKWLGYNIDGHSIQDNCNGITKSAGKHPVTKNKLHWQFI